MGVSKYGIKVSTSDQYVSDSQQTVFLVRVEKCFHLFLREMICVTKISLLALSKSKTKKKLSQWHCFMSYLLRALCIFLVGFMTRIHSFRDRAPGKRQASLYALWAHLPFSVAVLPSSHMEK